jgi:hypothetical protein
VTTTTVFVAVAVVDERIHIHNRNQHAVTLPLILPWEHGDHGNQKVQEVYLWSATFAVAKVNGDGDDDDDKSVAATV